MKKITEAIAAIMILAVIPVTAAYGADKETTPVQTDCYATFSWRVWHKPLILQEWSGRRGTSKVQ